MDKYVYNLIPDYSVIEYAEKDFWSNNSEVNTTNCDKGWYRMNKIEHGNFKLSSYRCILVSDYELNISGSNIDVFELSNYCDRYAYAIFDTEEYDLKKDIIVSCSKSTIVTEVIF